jgi:hypothetical protein
MLSAPLPRVPIGLPLLVDVEVSEVVRFRDLELFASIVGVFFTALGSRIELIF